MRRDLDEMEKNGITGIEPLSSTLQNVARIFGNLTAKIKNNAK
jgi:hypothetical protein